MKAFLLVLALIMSAHVMAGDKEKIMEVLQWQKQAWNAGDIPQYMQGYWQNDSLQFISKKGITKGWQATLFQYQKGYPDAAAMGQLTFSELEINVLSKQDAFVIGKWELAKKDTKVGGYFTLLFKKINGQWRIVVDHTS